MAPGSALICPTRLKPFRLRKREKSPWISVKSLESWNEVLGKLHKSRAFTGDKPSSVVPSAANCSSSENLAEGWWVAFSSAMLGSFRSPRCQDQVRSPETTSQLPCFSDLPIWLAGHYLIPSCSHGLSAIHPKSVDPFLSILCASISDKSHCPCCHMNGALLTTPLCWTMETPPSSSPCSDVMDPTADRPTQRLHTSHNVAQSFPRLAPSSWSRAAL